MSTLLPLLGYTVSIFISYGVYRAVRKLQR